MNRITWLLLGTVLFLSACLVHSTRIMQQQSKDVRWLLENCSVPKVSPAPPQNIAFER